MTQSKRIVELGFIYALTDPNSNEFVYIGATESAPKDRLKTHYNHFYEYLNNRRNETEKFKYFESIWPQKVNIKLLEIVQNDDLSARERYYIAKYSKLCHLLNETDGGNGGNTFSFKNSRRKEHASLLIAQKASQRTMSEEQKEMLSETRKGINNPMCGTGVGIPIVVFDKDDQPIHLCNYPFQITEFLDKCFPDESHKIHAGRVGNIIKGCKYNALKESKSAGFKFKYITNCSTETQEIVRERFKDILNSKEALILP